MSVYPLEQLNQTAAELLALFESLPDPAMQVYPEWSAQDVLAHLTFWHESFGRNVSDLAQGVKPTPLKGRLMDLNTGGVAAMRGLPLAAVMARFRAAQAAIRENILDEKVGMIPYRKGSRDYAAGEHLEIVIEHIRFHLRDVRKAIIPSPGPPPHSSASA